MKDVTVERFSRLVSGIYGAALAPQEWSSSLVELNRELGGTGIALLIPDATCWYNSTLPAEAGTSYREYFHRFDRVASATERGPVGLVRTGTELMPLVRDSEFSDWLRPNDIDDALVVRLTDAARPSCMIAAAPARTERFDTPERMKLMSGVVPHFQQALRAQAKMSSLAEANLGLADALDTVRHGTVIVGADLRVIDVNSAGEKVLNANDGLCIHTATLAATSALADRCLQRALRDALDDDGSGARGGRTLACERPSGKRPFLIDVVPLHRRIDDGMPDRRMALVLIVDPEPDGATPHSAALMLRRYGLTAAEVDVALRIAGGATVKEVGEQLSVSVTTVRKHLQHVFDKTDTHRQAELVRLVLAHRP